GAGSNSPVYIGTSYSNLIIENITSYNTNKAYISNEAHSVITLIGNPIDQSYISNISSNSMGTAVTVRLLNNTAPIINTSLLTINNVNLDSGLYALRLEGGKNIQIGNLSQAIVTGTYAVLVRDVNGQQVIDKLDFNGTLNLPTDVAVV